MRAYTDYSLNEIREKANFTVSKFVGSCCLAIFYVFLFQVHLAANMYFF